jgi:hypothetical protein
MKCPKCGSEVKLRPTYHQPLPMSEDYQHFKK